MKITKVYRYGLLPPIVNAEKVNEQIWLAHQYRNKLVEIEKNFRTKTQEIINCEELIEIDKQIAIAPNTEKKALWNKRTTLLKERRLKPEIAKALEDIKNTKYAQIRTARQECNVYWGTYLIIEQAAEAAAGGLDEPRFQRWDGTGAVGVQLQGGLLATQIFNLQDSRVQIDLTLKPIAGRCGKPRPHLKLRIGSEDNRPIWAEWPLIYHRPLPTNSIIKWIKVIKNKTASDIFWSVHISLEQEIPESTAHQEKTLALDLRWKQEETAEELTYRAGEWTNGVNSGKVILHPDIVGAFNKADSLRSIRDRNQNELQAELVDWAKKELPENHKEQLKHIVLWKSPQKFVRLALWWRDNRLDGDTEMYERLEAWRKQDKHLWLWEAHARTKALRRRKDQYRVLAAELVKSHDQLVVEKIALNRLAQKSEEESPGKQKARSQRVDVAPSELRQALFNAFRSQGKKIFEVCPGPLQSVWRAWLDGKGVEKKVGSARSARFNRLRGIKPAITPTEASVIDTARNVALEPQGSNEL